MNRSQRRAQWQARQRLASASTIGLAAALAPASGKTSRADVTLTAGQSAVNLQIGELVLRGFEKYHSSRIAAAFERSLAERLCCGELPALLRQSTRSSSLRLAPLTVRRASDPLAIGEQLAASVLAFEGDGRHRGGSR